MLERIRLSSIRGFVTKHAFEFAEREKIPITFHSIPSEMVREFGGIESQRYRDVFVNKKSTITATFAKNDYTKIDESVFKADAILSMYPGSEESYEIRTTRMKEDPEIGKTRVKTYKYKEWEKDRNVLFNSQARYKTPYFHIDTDSSFDYNKKVNEFVDFLVRNNVKELYVIGSEEFLALQRRYPSEVAEKFFNALSERLSEIKQSKGEQRKSEIKDACKIAVSVFDSPDAKTKERRIANKIHKIPFIQNRDLDFEGVNYFFDLSKFFELKFVDRRTVVRVFDRKSGINIANYARDRMGNEQFLIEDKRFFAPAEKKIIYDPANVVISSGGQNGMDRIALVVARTLGFKTSGQAPANYMTTTGSDRSLKDFGLIAKGDYRTRTYTNVENNQLTIRTAVDFNTPGEKATLNAIKRFDKPYFDVDGNLKADDIKAKAKLIAEFCVENNITRINIAGNITGVEVSGRVFMKEFLNQLKIQAKEINIKPGVKPATRKDVTGLLSDGSPFPKETKTIPFFHDAVRMMIDKLGFVVTIRSTMYKDGAVRIHHSNEKAEIKLLGKVTSAKDLEKYLNESSVGLKEFKTVNDWWNAGMSYRATKEFYEKNKYLFLYRVTSLEKNLAPKSIQQAKGDIKSNAIKQAKKMKNAGLYAIHGKIIRDERLAEEKGYTTKITQELKKKEYEKKLQYVPATREEFQDWIREEFEEKLNENGIEITPETSRWADDWTDRISKEYASDEEIRVLSHVDVAVQIREFMLNEIKDIGVKLSWKDEVWLGTIGDGLTREYLEDPNFDYLTSIINHVDSRFKKPKDIPIRQKRMKDEDKSAKDKERELYKEYYGTELE